MAGHSHWANIQHKKGAADAKRGKLWSKLSRAIIIAARSGGGDPTMNLKLRYAIDKAKQYSMPKDNIERAIKKGIGETDGQTFDEVIYEGIGPGGIFVMLEVVTDNRNRTAGEVRKLFEKSGGQMGKPGSAAYQFDRKGVFAIPTEGVDEEELMMAALDAGAEDMKREGDIFEITTDPSSFSGVQEALEGVEYTLSASEIAQVPKMPTEVDGETARKVLRLLEALDDHDDVQSVFSNLNMSDELIAELEAEAS